MTAVTRVAFASYQNTGTTAVPTPALAGSAVGDKLIRAITVSAIGASISDLAGWTLLADVTYNSRRTFILTRDYTASYPDIILSTGATAGTAIAALRAAPGYVLGSFTVGTKWDRPTDGGGSVTTTTMKSMTGQADGITLAITAETSTAAETEAQVTFSGAGWSKWFYADTDPASDVAANFWFGYRDIGAIASGDVVSTWPNASNNSMGIQVSLGQTASGGSATGNLDTVGVYQNTATSLVAGARLITAGTVEAVLRQGGTETQRKTLSFTSGRGNAEFTGLTPNTAYTVTFEAGGVAQSDVQAAGRTLRTGAASFVAVSGSCMFTASTHPIFDRIADDNPDFWTIQGDAHYENSTTEVGWWAGMVSSLNAFRGLPRKVVTRWTPDNHDTIRTTPLGGGAPALPPAWKQLAGASNWGSSDSVGQAWKNGRVLFIQTDLRSARDNYATPDPSPLRLLGVVQKAWFKGLLTAAESDSSVALIVWFDSWIGLRQDSGRWGSYPEEYAELNSHIQSLTKVKSHLVLIGGDTHNLWADSGTRAWTEAAFPGIPSLNISGYNRASPAETFFIPDIANATLMTSGVEADWGGYSRLTITDLGGSSLDFKWDAIRVNSAGVSDTMATWSKTFSADPVPSPGSGSGTASSDLEIAWLRKVSGPSSAATLEDLRQAVYGTSERAYWVAKSGLPVGSLADHKLAAMKADTGATGSLADVSRVYWAKNSA